MSSRVTCDGCGAEIAKGQPSIGVTVNVGQVFESADACSGGQCVGAALAKACEWALHRHLSGERAKTGKS